MKNDLINLFRWNTSLDIKNRDGSVVTTLYIRLVGDVDYNQAQQFGLVSSRKLRKRLKDNKSAEHQALFLDLEDRTKDELILGTLISEVSNFRDLAMEELGTEFFDTKVPEDADTLEDREKQQEAEDELVKEKSEKLRAKMEEKSNTRKLELEKLNIKELCDIFVDSSINARCLEEFSTAFREYCIFAGTYTDKNFKDKAFVEFDDFRNTSPNLKRQIIDAYLQLELSGEQLKN